MSFHQRSFLQSFIFCNHFWSISLLFSLLFSPLYLSLLLFFFFNVISICISLFFHSWFLFFFPFLHFDQENRDQKIYSVNYQDVLLKTFLLGHTTNTLQCLVIIIEYWSSVLLDEFPDFYVRLRSPWRSYVDDPLQDFRLFSKILCWDMSQLCVLRSLSAWERSVIHECMSIFSSMASAASVIRHTDSSDKSKSNLTADLNSLYLDKFTP